MKRNLLSIIILALLVVNIVLTTIMMISVTSASKKTAQLVADISSIIKLEIDGLPESETAVYSISEELTIPLKTEEDGKAHYAVGNVSLSMNTAHDDYATYGDAESMKAREGLLKDIIFSVIGNYTMQEAQQNSEQIKSEILSKIQVLFDSDFIYGVSFNFLYS